jgi:hypothetical protein
MKKYEEEQRREILACLIIDDPLLRPRYGCIDYSKLLAAMKAHSFFTEIAFIPWNYKRSDPKTVRLFKENSEYFAICVHGCNHTGNEFGFTNYDTLSKLASTALWRMEEHKKDTGLSYDPVIVFPQGKFSSTAMKALKETGYFAAFNSTIMAVDSQPPDEVEYLKPATRIYHDFPLFLRRYPKDKDQFIQDVEAGRPIVIVEHHSAFREGYRNITDLVDFINSLGNIRWTSLMNIATHYLGEKFERSKLVPSNHQHALKLNMTSKLRRILSEARDSYIETNSTLTKLYWKLRS